LRGHAIRQRPLGPGSPGNEGLPAARCLHGRLRGECLKPCRRTISGPAPGPGFTPPAAGFACSDGPAFPRPAGHAERGGKEKRGRSGAVLAMAPGALVPFGPIRPVFGTDTGQSGCRSGRDPANRHRGKQRPDPSCCICEISLLHLPRRVARGGCLTLAAVGGMEARAPRERRRGSEIGDW